MPPNIYAHTECILGLIITNVAVVMCELWLVRYRPYYFVAHYRVADVSPEYYYAALLIHLLSASSSSAIARSEMISSFLSELAQRPHNRTCSSACGAFLQPYSHCTRSSFIIIFNSQYNATFSILTNHPRTNYNPLK